MRHKEKAKKNPCLVFWGTHGCRKQYGHRGNHLCQPGCLIGDVTNPDIYFYGEHYAKTTNDNSIEIQVPAEC